MQIDFYERRGGMWVGTETLAGEEQAKRFLAEWRENFQRRHGELPANGVDYKLESVVEDVYATPPRVSQEQEQSALLVVQGIRQALHAEASVEDDELPQHVRRLIDAASRALELADDAQALGRGRNTALAAIIGILSQALTTMGMGERA